MPVGIVSYDVYLPRWRLDRRKIQEAVGWAGAPLLPGEKAVANWDEDSLTMAQAAAMGCLGEGRKVEGLIFASTTNPLREGEASAVIATSLGLDPGVRTADLGNSLKAGTSALLWGLDAVRAGAEGVLVCGADLRLGKPGSMLEQLFGDGAAAFLLGTEDLVAEFKGSFTLTQEFIDFRRLPQDQFVHGVEERFIREEGYGRFIPEAVKGLLEAHGLSPKAFAKVGYPCLNPGQYYRMAKAMGFEAEQLQEPLLGKVGEAGCASPLLILAAMLDGAEPGDNLLLVSYGNGAEALWFEVKEGIEARRGRFQRALGRGKALPSYERYLAFRGLLPLEVELLGDVPASQPPLLWRERRMILGLWGSRCRRCGTPQYPPQRVCVNPDCGAVDEMEPYRFVDKPAKLFTFTADHSAETLNPPMVYGLVDFEGGGRFVFEVTDCEPDEVKIGMPLMMSLRRKYEDRQRGFVGYYWKAIPAY